jgi:3-hydroxyisobutyrate dehydrogenase-like beta-hydroxyacid dehydrogenase
MVVAVSTLSIASFTSAHTRRVTQESVREQSIALSTHSTDAAGPWVLINLSPSTIKRDFNPGFMIDLIQKDLKLIMEAAAEMRLNWVLLSGMPYLVSTSIKYASRLWCPHPSKSYVVITMPISLMSH